ncbi:MAG: O-antigen ligase domain-containing protein [Nitrospinota bacterium]|nr:MAG: O-antigen ligase domain-containing protein [Nitrospinota bacterium]
MNRKPMLSPSPPLSGLNGSRPRWYRARQLVVKAFGGGQEPIPIIRYVYYAFVFSIPFEAVDASFLSMGRGQFTIAKMLGYLFIVGTLLQPRICYNFPPKAFWGFASYLYVYMILGLLQDPVFTGAILSRLFMLVQMLVLFWLSYNMMRHEQVSRGTLWMLATSCILLALFQVAGTTSSLVGHGRISASGVNPNTFSSVLSLGLLSLIGLTYGQGKTSLRFRLLTWGGLGLLGFIIVLTGSRGAIIALMTGFLAFLLKAKEIRHWLQTHVRGSRWKISLIIAVGLLFLIGFSYFYEPARARWEKTINEGSMAGRERIWPAAWSMFLDKPLTGWGPVNHWYELGSRLGLRVRDPHSLYLSMLTETGLLGALPFFAGLWLCWCAAWKGRGGSQGVLPIAILLALLVINVKGTWFNQKLFWIGLAYAAASGSSVSPFPRLQKVVRVPRRIRGGRATGR